MSVDAGAPPRAARGRTAIAVIVVLASMLPLTAWARAAATDARDRAERELASAREQEASVASELENLQRTLRDTSYAHASTEDQARAASNAAAATIDDQRITFEELVVTGRLLEERRSALSSSTSYSAAQRQGASDLDGCVRAVMDAVGLLNSDKRPEGVARLQGAVDVCRRAESYLTSGQTNPEFPWDFADPFVVHTGDAYTAYATNAVGGHIQVISSPDLQHWTWVGEALPNLPAWAEPQRTWAPAAIKLGERYALYYTARHAQLDRQCISVGFSDQPHGPFVDESTEPLVCQHERNGSIDPSPFVDITGTPYLLWKSEDETTRGRKGQARLWSAPLVPDGSRLAFVGVELLKADREDEQRVVEGPSMLWTLEGYFLVYSANRFDTADYRVDFAKCDGPSGPCHKPPDNKLLWSFNGITGPGGAEWFRAPDGSPMLSYHAWVGDGVGFPNRRILHTLRMQIKDDRPVPA